jgi:glutathione synthase/RimK-type ligase-like ATP-grasp enzyme
MLVNPVAGSSDKQNPVKISAMKIGVLASPDSWHFQDLQRAAGTRHQIESCPFDQLADRLDAPHPTLDSKNPGRHPLEEFDCLLARAMPAGSIQQIIFRMDLLLELEHRGLRIVNPPRTIEMSVVFKPLFGSMGHGLVRLSSPQVAERVFTEQIASGQVIYQQVFVDHGGFDIRLFVIGSHVLAMKRVNPSNWITNIAQGATGYPYQPSQQDVELALKSARAVGAEIAGVDLLYDQKTQQPRVLEINSAPAWQAISQVLGIDVAALILEYLEHQQPLH